MSGQSINTDVNTDDTNSNAPEPPAPAVPNSTVIDPAVVGVDPSQYNLRNPAVKRILREAAELATPSDEVYARPLEDNLFEWHFTIRGAPDSDFAVGVYHGRIILPTEYPMKPPSIILLTPNGRFETGTKICLSISSYHPETWRPSWSIRTALVALISFMTTDSPGAIGSVEMPSDARRDLARRSLTWECPTCGPSITHIKYRCAGTSSGAAKAQQLFRLPHPHDPRQVRDYVIPPETITRIRNPPEGPITMPFDARSGDSRAQIRAEREDDGGEVEEEDVGVVGTPMLGLAIGGILICIGGIIFRRMFNSSWWDLMFN